MNNNKFFPIYHPSHHAPPDEDNDLLYYGDYAEAIYRQIHNMKSYNIGITFGVLGEWGMGKTTVLNILSEKFIKHKNPENGILSKIKNLFQENPFIVIRFDAWQYLRQEELWLALIRKITYGIYSDKSIYKVKLFAAIWWQRLTKNPQLFSSLTRYGVATIIFILLGVIGILGLSYLLVHLAILETVISEIGIAKVSLGSFDINITKWTIIIFWAALIYKIGQVVILEQIKTNLPPLTKSGFEQGKNIVIDDFKDDFYAMVKSLGKERILVVLIDDLDRCPPNQIVPTLEAIKQLGFDGSYSLDKNNKGMADIAKIVFVLAIDQTAVIHALSGYFKDYFQGAEKEKDIYQFAKNYIAKIIQVPVMLPPLSETQLDGMLSEVIRRQ